MQAASAGQVVPPYSANFKEVMAMVRAGEVPGDVATIDDRQANETSVLLTKPLCY